MTAPVVSQRAAPSTSIAMTAPVLAADSGGDMHTIAFVMPRSYTLATLPAPTDARVRLVAVPEKTVAAMRFSWYRSTARMQAMQQQLLQDLKRDGIQTIGTPSYAGYNAPWTPPWLVRNEVLVEVSQ